MTATITASAEPAAIPPRVRLDVTTDQTSLTLYRVQPDGQRIPVRSYDGGPFPVSGGTLVAYDPEAHFGMPVTYTADGAGVTGSASVTVTSEHVWAVHPGVPSRSQIVELRSLSPRSYEANQSLRYPLNRRFPIVASDGRRKAPTYDMKLLTETLDDLGPLEELLDDLAPLLLNIPPGMGLGQASEYVAVGRVSMGRLVQIANEPMREWDLACSVTGRPVGGSQVDNTYAKSLALYPTYADRLAAHATYGEAFDPA
jgi:hypothetical protein